MLSSQKNLRNNPPAPTRRESSIRSIRSLKGSPQIAGKNLKKSRLRAGSGSVVPPSPKNIDAFKLYGEHVFTGKVADTYLERQGSSGKLLDNPAWVKNEADTVAAAVLDW